MCHHVLSKKTVVVITRIKGFRMTLLANLTLEKDRRWMGQCRMSSTDHQAKMVMDLTSDKPFGFS